MILYCVFSHKNGSIIHLYLKKKLKTFRRFQSVVLCSTRMFYFNNKLLNLLNFICSVTVLPNANNKENEEINEERVLN